PLEQTLFTVVASAVPITGAESCLPGRRLTEVGLQDVPHVHFFNLVGLQPRLRDRPSDGHGAELHGWHLGQGATEAPDGGARGADDNDLLHRKRTRGREDGDNGRELAVERGAAIALRPGFPHTWAIIFRPPGAAAAAAEGLAARAASAARSARERESMASGSSSFLSSFSRRRETRALSKFSPNSENANGGKGFLQGR
ncbi:MAG: hypothetical protein BJ554DRAFT_3298, partial [Olpidium bornovanus]